MSQPPDFHDEAHLFVAAVRVLAHKRQGPPTPEDVCDLLDCSGEWGLAILRRLKELGVMETTGDAFATRLFVADYPKLEEIPRERKGTGLGEELKKFQAGREDLTRKVKTIQAELDRKKQELFAELQQKIKQSTTCLK